jgi:hypothetical protein
MIPEREAVDEVDAARHVEALPRRVAHVAHALQITCDELGGGPARPREIVVYDREAMTVNITCAALHRAMVDFHLVDRWGRGLYVPTALANDLKQALEDRYLGDQGDLQ